MCVLPSIIILSFMESSALLCCIGVPLSNAANVASLSLLIASASSCAVNEADKTDFRRFTMDRFRFAKLCVTSIVVVPVVAVPVAAVVAAAAALVSQLGKVGVGAVLFVDSLFLF